MRESVCVCERERKDRGKGKSFMRIRPPLPCPHLLILLLPSQLMSVLPPESSLCLPPQLQALMTNPQSPISSFFPGEFSTDLNGKRFAWQGKVTEDDCESALMPFTFLSFSLLSLSVVSIVPPPYFFALSFPYPKLLLS